jgi:hypothetical protein
MWKSLQGTMWKSLLRYYVEDPSIMEDTKIKGTLDYTINLCEPTNASKEELFHSRRALVSQPYFGQVWG